MLFHVKGDIRDVLILFALQLVVLSFCIPTADESIGQWETVQQ